MGIRREHVVYVIQFIIVTMARTGNLIITITLILPITIGNGIWNLSAAAQDAIETSDRLDIINKVNDAIERDVHAADLTKFRRR